MATLQTSRQTSAFTARSRLKQVVHDRPALAIAGAADPCIEQVEQKITPSVTEAVENAFSSVSSQRLSEIEQRQLLLQTVKVYDGWQLISIKYRPESDSLIAHLMRTDDLLDPVIAMRDGRTMQIIMDSMGDMKVQYARRPQTQQQQSGFWARLFAPLTALFASKA
jgi:hypothetical protein